MFAGAAMGPIYGEVCDGVGDGGNPWSGRPWLLTSPEGHLPAYQRTFRFPDRCRLCDGPGQCHFLCLEFGAQYHARFRAGDCFARRAHRVHGLVYIVIRLKKWWGLITWSSIFFFCRCLLPVWMTYRNFQLVQTPWTIIPLNLLKVLSPWVVTVMVVSGISHRAWEYVMPGEAKHGMATLSGTAHPGIWATANQVIALLPDGQFVDGGGGNEKRPLRIEGILSKRFNWISVAATATKGAGIRADGSLWRIGADQVLEQIGTETDWRQVAAGNNHFLALKYDGTIWGWGDNTQGQLVRSGPGG